MVQERVVNPCCRGNETQILSTGTRLNYLEDTSRQASP
jgi:hypothetical protein